MASKRGIQWEDKKLKSNLHNMPRQVDRALTAIMGFEAPRVQGAMRRGATWTDQTGNARSGLSAKPFKIPHRVYGIILNHSVPYGIWLEVRFSGRYAIIQPTIASKGPEVMATVATLFSRLGR